MHLRTALRAVYARDVTQNLLYFGVVTRMVCAGHSIELAATTPEMRHRKVATCALGPSRHGSRIVAATAAFEAME